MRTTEKSIFKRVGPFVFALLQVQPGARAQVLGYDLLLKGGHVIDPANGLDAKMDVAVSGGKIVAVEKDIHTNEAGPL
ncbi:MAG TPA: hypothetical protein VNB49_05695 [Candidatus Dormibacteraeota bacterium]|nr:hypothetical protein [Candidatus Dormibacteraeota bacterium]